MLKKSKAVVKVELSCEMQEKLLTPEAQVIEHIQQFPLSSAMQEQFTSDARVMEYIRRNYLFAIIK